MVTTNPSLFPCKAFLPPLPPDVPDDVGVLITGDGLGVPYHTSRKIAGDDVKTIVVFGLGPIGLGNVLVQAHLGRKVIAVDFSPERRRMALDFGVVEALDARARCGGDHP